MDNERIMGQQAPPVQPSKSASPTREGGGVTSDPNKVRDPNTETPSKVEQPSRVEFPDIAKPDAKPQTGKSAKGGNVQPPREPAE